MTAPTRDPATTQAIARALHDGALRICGCGVPYADTADGRHRHRLVYGHTASGQEKD